MTDSDQAARWNGPAGRAWVEAQRLLDGMFAPFERMIADAVAAGPGGDVLDVGCGTGATTLAAARALGAGGRCVGVDISEPMLALAQARAARDGLDVRFIHADAQTHGFETESVDLIVSRFGVMFFADPTAAFANLRRAARTGAGLRLFAWRSAAENPFMTTAERAAAPLVPDLPARPADGPGQFAFADRDRVARILAESGWTDVDIRPVDVVCTLPEAELLFFASRLGPLGTALQAAGAATRARLLAAIRAAFDPYVDGADVRYTAACWSIGARAAARPAAGTQR